MESLFTLEIQFYPIWNNKIGGRGRTWKNAELNQEKEIKGKMEFVLDSCFSYLPKSKRYLGK